MLVTVMPFLSKISRRADFVHVEDKSPTNKNGGVMLAGELLEIDVDSSRRLGLRGMESKLELVEPTFDESEAAEELSVSSESKVVELRDVLVRQLGDRELPISSRGRIETRLDTPLLIRSLSKFEVR